MALLLAILYMVYGFFVLYVIVQMVLRLALIDVLLALAPIALGLWILPHTAGWGRHWLRLFMTTVFQQAIQLIALALGFGFLQGGCAHSGLRAGAGPDLEAAHVAGLRLHGDPGAVDARQRRDLRLLALDALFRHEPALVAGAVGPDHRAWWLAARREGRGAWRWGRWRPARAFRLRRAASARRLRWRPHRRAETGAATPPGAQTSNDDRNGARERPAPIDNRTKEVGAMCS